MFNKITSTVDSLDPLQAKKIVQESKIDNHENMLMKIEECVEDKVHDLVKKA